MKKPKIRYFTKWGAAEKYWISVRKRGYSASAHWDDRKGKWKVYNIKKDNYRNEYMTNPGILKALKKGFKGTVKLVGKTLQFRS